MRGYSSYHKTGQRYGATASGVRASILPHIPDVKWNPFKRFVYNREAIADAVAKAVNDIVDEELKLATRNIHEGMLKESKVLSERYSKAVENNLRDGERMKAVDKQSRSRQDALDAVRIAVREHQSEQHSLPQNVIDQIERILIGQRKDDLSLDFWHTKS